jgi:hypothetical protein
LQTTPGYGVEYGYAFCRKQAAGGSFSGVFLLSDDTDHHWHIQIQDSSGTLQLDYDTGVAFTQGNVYGRRLVVSGANVTAYVDSGSGYVQVGTTQTDSWCTTFTFCGFGCNANGSTSFVVPSVRAA